MGGWFERFRVGRTRFRPSQPPLHISFTPGKAHSSWVFSDDGLFVGVIGLCKEHSPQGLVDSW